MNNLYAFGIGIGTKNTAGEWLEVFYPVPMLNPDNDLAAILTSSLDLNNGDIEPSNQQLSSLASALDPVSYTHLTLPTIYSV